MKIEFTVCLLFDLPTCSGNLLNFLISPNLIDKIVAKKQIFDILKKYLRVEYLYYNW